MIVELSYLLKTKGNLSKKEIIHELRNIISRPNIETEEEVIIALEIFENYPIDKIVDALGISKALKKVMDSLPMMKCKLKSLRN